MALTDKLTSIANAIREKSGTTEKLTLDAMPTAIAALPTGGGEGGEDLVPNPIIFTGDCRCLFYKDRFNWVLHNYLDRIQFNNITGSKEMFFDNKEIKKCPSITQKENTPINWDYAFGSSNFEEIGDIINWCPISTSSMFNSCRRLRYLPNFINTKENIGTSDYTYYMFSYCHSLREISPSFLGLIGTNGRYSYYPYTCMFQRCYALNEVVGLRVSGMNEQGTADYNSFSNTFEYCYHLKRVVFATQEDGTPHKVKWKKQTIDLSKYAGWAGYGSADKDITTNYNSGITADKEVANAADYERLKDDPDWWSRQFAFSRFGHDAAVELINSLPDASAYIATQTGTGNNNIVKFYKNAGMSIDGGGVSDLTEEEIAVAAAKGWTISYTG